MLAIIHGHNSEGAGMTLGYALDTSVLSETSKERPNVDVVIWIARLRRAVIPMGVITEFEQGIHLRATYDLKGAIRLLEWLEGLLATGIKVADTDTRVARKYGEMRACKSIRHLDMPNQDSGKLGGQDLHIAATAIENGLVVATLNIRDFLLIHHRFPLPGLYDPKANHWYAYPGSKQVCPLEKTMRGAKVQKTDATQNYRPTNALSKERRLQ
jgi:predicted nucleic acid-binding protein